MAADLKALVKNGKFIPHDEAEFEKRVRLICQRIGVNPDIDDRIIRWAVIGMILCLQQPEFGKQRGRPRKIVSDAEHLANLIDGARKMLTDLLPGKITDERTIELIKALAVSDPRLSGEVGQPLRNLTQATTPSLLKKVSGGRKKRNEGTKK